MNFGHRILRVHLAPAFSVLAAMVLLAGCGGVSVGTPMAAPTPPPAEPVSIQGQWQVIAQSAVNPASSVLVETNFTQTGANVIAGKSSVILIQGALGAFTGLGGECDNGSLGDDSVQATIANQTQLSFTLTEAGSLGTASSTGTATISSDGTQITSGTYSTPAACGFTADNGSITGTLIKPFSGTYAGVLSGTDAVTVTVSQTGYNLSVTGTDNGTSFTLTGTAVGATFDVTGTIAGQAVENVGIYEPATNDFRIYDTKFHLLGVLTTQSTPSAPSPISVVVAPVTASVQAGQGMSFTATVANDSSNKGVSWALSGAGCSGATCGTLSAASSASGGVITYTAPATVPGAVTLTATSVADTTKSASASITVTAPPAIAVTLSPTMATVQVSATQAFTATVQNDTAAKGVTWTLSGAGCSGATCGTVSAASSESGVAVTYTAPTTLPNPATVTLTATSVADSKKAAAASITVIPAPAIAVSVSPTTVSLATGERHAIFYRNGAK